MSPHSRPGPRWSAVLLTVIGVLLVTLRAVKPWGEVIEVELCLMCGDRALADLFVNVVLFVPVGLALQWAGASRRWRWGLPAVTAVGIEVAQLFIPGRYTTLSDPLANVLGAQLGVTLPALISWWRRPGRGADLRVIAAGTAAAAAILGWGWLQRPYPVPEPTFVHATPNFEDTERWTGEFTTMTLDRRPVAHGWLPESTHVLARLAAGEPLRLSGVAGRESERLAPMFALTHPGEPVLFEIAALGPHVLVHPRRNAARVGLASSSVRFEDPLARVDSGAPLDFSLLLAAGATCMDVNGDAHCVRHPGPGGLWRAFYDPSEWTLRVRGALDLIGLTLLLGPFALVAPVASMAARVTSGALMSAAAWLAPQLGPVSSPGLDALAAAACLLVVFRLRRD